MEEQRKRATALEGLASSELGICGGIALDFDLGGIVAIIRKIIDFLDDYIPELLRGFQDGFNLKK